MGDLLSNLNNVSVQYNKSISHIEFNGDDATNAVDFDGNKYNADKIILCSGAIQTPCILQRSGIDCGNKLFDHGGFTITYGKYE